MKKLFSILAKTTLVTALFATATITSGCEFDDVRRITVDDIRVYPNEWQVYTVDGLFDHYYVDIALPELNSMIFNNGFYYTYWKYQDGQAIVQEGEGVTMHLERPEGNEWVAYTETISCSYSVGSMRIMISRSDFYDGRPGDTLVFRFVAFE
jgi:hypothetical protein